MKDKKEETATAATTATENSLPAQQTDNAPAMAGGKNVELASMDEMVNAIESAKSLGDVSKMEVGTINLKSEYLSFETPGAKIRRVFIGFTMRMSVDPVSGEEKGLVPAAQLYDPATEMIHVCMQSVLVGVLYEVRYPKGSALEITYKGDKKGKNGLRYQDFDIRALIPTKK